MGLESYNTDTFPVFPNWSWKHRNTRMETLVETLETQWKHNPIAKPQLLHRCRVHTHVAAHAAPAVRTHMPQSKGTDSVPTDRVRRTATRRVRGWSDRFRLRGRGT